MKENSSDSEDANDGSVSGYQEISDEGNQHNCDGNQSQETFLKKELRNLSFQELKELKDRIGSKLYNEAVFGSKNVPTKQNFKRANKNRPRQMSSKVPVSPFMEVFQTKKKQHRDPRYDDKCGEFDQRTFKTTYSFIKDVKAREKQELQKELSTETTSERKSQIKYLLNRIENQENAEKLKVASEKREKKFKEEAIQQLKEGKQPYFLKKSDKRMLELAEHYKELKKSGKLSKYLEKKRKKNARKDRRYLPS